MRRTKFPGKLYKDDFFKKDMNKRGQIALFVILAILLVAAIILLAYFRPQIFRAAVSPEEAQRIVTSQLQPIRDFTDGCMLLAARKTLNTMGRQGGYVVPKSAHFSIPTTVPDAPIMNYALFYDPERGHVNELPSTEELKDELVRYLEANVDFVTCIDDYDSFRDLVDIEVVNALPAIDRENIELGENSGQIVVPYNYPVRISKQNASASLEEYELVIPINLARIREHAARITNSVASGENYISVIASEGEKEFAELKENPNAEKMFTDAEAYTLPITDQTGVIYNEKNLIFNIRYENPSLAVPYEFRFLIGNP